MTRLKTKRELIILRFMKIFCLNLSFYLDRSSTRAGNDNYHVYLSDSTRILYTYLFLKETLIMMIEPLE
jgi:hypothetical protein